MPEMKRVGELWRKTWSLYLSDFKFMFMLVLLLSLPVALLYLFAPYSAYEPDFSHGKWIYLILTILVAMLFGVIMNISLNYYIYQTTKNGRTKTTYTQAIKFSLSKFWSALGTYIILILCVIGLFILLIVPGIIFAMYWSFVTPVIIIKGLYGKKAMDYSKSVVKKRWWKTLWYCIVLTILPIIITLAISLIFSSYYPTNFGYFIYYLVTATICSTFMSVAGIVLFLELDRTKVK